MPLQSGKSQSVVSRNIRELHSGKTYRRTRLKFGKAKANAQAVAIALDKAGLSRNQKRKRRLRR